MVRSRCRHQLIEGVSPREAKSFGVFSNNFFLTAPHRATRHGIDLSYDRHMKLVFPLRNPFKYSPRSGQIFAGTASDGGEHERLHQPADYPYG